ncbi:MAG: DUF4249 domain-containing protein [Bacteroidales bacterium]|nr:DUF4249 domain-containing protein [Bacteroidales bacterium]
MRKIFSILLLAISALGIFSSCQKEITLPYRSIDPLLVIEARVNQDSAAVSLKRTVDMESLLEESPVVTDAKVSLLFGDQCVSFSYSEADSLYHPDTEFAGVPGTTYTLDVEDHGNRYTSTSMMHSPVQIIDHGFRSMEIAGIKTWLYSATVQDTPGEENYYVYYFYEDGVASMWNVLYDKGHDGEVLHFDIPMQIEDENLESMEEYHFLPVGGEAKFEVRSVDKKTYDYVYSLAVTMMTYGNPVNFFDGMSSKGESIRGLGYFTSYSSSSISDFFNKEDTFVDSSFKFPFEF